LKLLKRMSTCSTNSAVARYSLQHPPEWTKKFEVSLLPYVVDYHNSLHWKIAHITLQGSAVIKNLYTSNIIPHITVFAKFFSHKSYSWKRVLLLKPFHYSKNIRFATYST
jgi:hypothetical protein